MHDPIKITSGKQHRMLGFSTLAFTVCFAVWTIFSIIGVKIKQDLGLSETEFGILVATPVLTGSVSRIFLGVWTEQYGGRLVFALQMLATAVATVLVSIVTTYEMFLVAALGVGVAGGSFIVGIAYVSRWYPENAQGTALGIFGAGNVGAAVTNFGAPFLLLAFGWEQTVQIYAGCLAVMAILFYVTTEDDPETRNRKAGRIAKVSVMNQIEPLKKLQVWRFASRQRDHTFRSCRGTRPLRRVGFVHHCLMPAPCLLGFSLDLKFQAHYNGSTIAQNLNNPPHGCSRKWDGAHWRRCRRPGLRRC